MTLSSKTIGRLAVPLLGAMAVVLMIFLSGGISAAQQKKPAEADAAERDAKIIERFHRLFYRTEPYLHTQFLGVAVEQYPSDNWVMQEIIFETKPDYIIETGTAYGGTTLFYAVILAQVSPQGKIITVDISRAIADAEKFPVWKERVEFLNGSSVDADLVKKIAAKVKGKKTLVTLDSDHHKEHVLKELELYSPMVSVGSYLVVQDTHLGGHPLNHPSTPKGAGPREALDEFLKTNDRFVIDKSREKYLISQYPSGFLKRAK